MWVIETFSFVGGTVMMAALVHMVVFWVARFLYPPQPPKVVQPPVVIQPVQAPSVPVPQIPAQSYPPLSLPVLTEIHQLATPPPLPASYAENTFTTQVPVINNDPLPPPVQMGKRSENE